MAEIKQRLLHKTTRDTVYRQMVKCGKANCKCARGELHGPYYARFWRVGDRLYKQYICKADGEALWQQCVQRRRQRHTLAEVDARINRLRLRFEQNLAPDEVDWVNQRLQELKIERDTHATKATVTGQPPALDIRTVLTMRQRLDTLLSTGTAEQTKELVRECVDTVILHPEQLKVEIRYRVPGEGPELTNSSFLMETGVHCQSYGSGGRY